MRPDFEEPIRQLEERLNDLKHSSTNKKINIEPEIKRIEQKLEKLRSELYSNLTDWQRVQIARHNDRPYTLDYIHMIVTDFVELHGDRLFADDLALVGGFAKINDRKVLIMGHQKGRGTKEKIIRNFGCAHPEGYRKAIRLMQMADKFKLPIVVLIDTPGAYPGVGAEERGQAQAIASNLRDMVKVGTPIIAIVIGEGGSGGALGVGVADKVCILQHAYYSVISPEGCASILWRSSLKAPEAAAALKLTAEHLLKLGIIDEIIPEPLGGAHRNPEFVATHLKESIVNNLDALAKFSREDLLEKRYQRFRKLGVYETIKENGKENGKNE